MVSKIQVNEKRLDQLLGLQGENAMYCPENDNGETIECDASITCAQCWKNFLAEQPVPAMPDQLFTMRNKPQ